ncbi:MAG: hypothetical protein ABIF92_01280 [archaeon]
MGYNDNNCIRGKVRRGPEESEEEQRIQRWKGLTSIKKRTWHQKK